MNHSSVDTLVASARLVETRESNARTYARSINRVITRGEGATVWDANGKAYIDCLCCAGALPLGHRHPHVMAQVRTFLESDHLLQGLDIATPAKIEFVSQLLRTLPPEFAESAKLQFCGPSGSDAVEAAIKLFKTATGRRSVLSFHGAYHGMTMGSLSLMGDVGPRQQLGGYMPEVHFLPYPYAFRCPFGVGGERTAQLSLHYIESMLTDPNSGICRPAMLILEPIQGEGGCIPASAEWLRGIRDITRRLDIPLVIDEVQTGFGRTGTMFAYEIAQITPDAVVMSKAVGGGFPLAVLAYHERFDTWAPGAHAGTFRGNQIALAAGSATLRYLAEHRVADAAARAGSRLRAKLSALAQRHPAIGDVRGRGLMLGLEMVDPAGTPDRLGRPPADGALARRAKAASLHEGLIVETGGRHGSVLRLLPPLIITDQEIDAIAARLDRAIARALDPA